MRAVVAWSDHAEGVLKFSHNDPVQCLAYNPLTQQLASGTASDFGIWSPEQKSVPKQKVSSKVLSAAWSADGQYLALGMYNGHVSVCDKGGSEQMRIERNAPVWTLQWNLTPNKSSDTLVVGCWNGTLSFYNLAGKQIGSDKLLGFDPCSIAYHDEKFLCIGGSSKQVIFCTKDGAKLTTLCETTDCVWTVRSRPKKNYIALGTNDGSISMLQITYLTIHGLHLERYAFRDSLTDLVIHNLLSNEKVRIKCHEYITKIAVYNRQVAVQLPSAVHVYELLEHKDIKESYQLSTQIKGNVDCNLLVLTSEHVLLCQIHGLHLERYAFRDTLTDLVIHNLLSNEKVRIKCREYITKIAVYNRLVAVYLKRKLEST